WAVGAVAGAAVAGQMLASTTPVDAPNYVDVSGAGRSAESLAEISREMLTGQAAFGLRPEIALGAEPEAGDSSLLTALDTEHALASRLPDVPPGAGAEALPFIESSAALGGSALEMLPAPADFSPLSEPDTGGGGDSPFLSSPTTRQTPTATTN